MKRIHRRITLPIAEVKALHKQYLQSESQKILFRSLWAKVQTAQVSKQAYIGKDKALHVYMIDKDISETTPTKRGMAYTISIEGDVTARKYDTDSLTELRNLVRYDACEK